MPYCNICGKFENVVDFRKLCTQCAKIPLDGSTRNVSVRQQRQIMRSHNNSKFLYYPAKFQEIAISPLSEQEPNGFGSASLNSSISNAHIPNSRLPNSRLPSIIPNSLRNSLLRQFNIHANVPIRSRMALIFGLLGWLFFFFQTLVFLSLFFQFFALIMAIRARRSEPRNKILVLAWVVSLSYWIVLIVGTIILLSDPELIEMLEQQLEEQMIQ
ncbi:MAG: hypothetical protein ACTSYI_10035 [Promethearchaeota archaeon]